MSLPKHKYLLTYRYTEIVSDLTQIFCKAFLNEFKDRRTIEQMTQAARSGKQNIVEAVGQSNTSKKGEIKLLGVANASLEELIADFEDFLRQRNVAIWPKTDPRIFQFKTIAYRLSSLSNLSDQGYLREKPTLPQNPEAAANFMLTLCHLATFLLSKQISSLEQRFIDKGGFTENLFKRRLDSRMSR